MKIKCNLNYWSVRVLPVSRRQTICTIIFLWAMPLGLLLPTSTAWAANYHGQVIDTETGKPIGGAVVVVEWHKKAFLSMNGGWSFHNVRETLTDAQGNFLLDSSEGINWNPFTFVQAPIIIAFYPGYLPFTPGNPGDIKGGLYEITDVLERGAVVKLTRLRSDKELKRFTDKSSIGGIRAPYSKIPNLLRLINIQRKMVGLGELSIGN